MTYSQIRSLLAVSLVGAACAMALGANAQTAPAPETGAQQAAPATTSAPPAPEAPVAANTPEGAGAPSVGTSAPPAPPSPAAPPPVEAPPPVAAPDVAPRTTSLIPPAPAGLGQVVFYRPSRFVGMALSFTVHEGFKGLGKLPNGTYFVVAAEPGQHTYSVESEATDKLTLEIDAGETYYVEQTIGVGVVMGRPHIAPSDEARFTAKRLKLSTAKFSDKQPRAGTTESAAAAPAGTQ